MKSDRSRNGDATDTRVLHNTTAHHAAQQASYWPHHQAMSGRFNAQVASGKMSDKTEQDKQTIQRHNVAEKKNRCVKYIFNKTI